MQIYTLSKPLDALKGHKTPFQQSVLITFLKNAVFQRGMREDWLLRQTVLFHSH